MQSQVKFFGACKNISGASHQRGAAMFSQTTHVDGNNLKYYQDIQASDLFNVCVR